MKKSETAAFEIGEYSFRPIENDDLPTLHAWLGEPHVREWWGDPDEELELIKENFVLDWVESCLVAHRGDPFAYILCYDIFAEDYRPFPEQPMGSRGIDQFIGPRDMINVGHGSRFISAFAAQMLALGAPRIVTDPDPANARAIAAYTKAGFTPLDRRDTPWGRCLLMALDGENRTMQ
jgi:aminoglycoside 6'-N-acetyltransferase